MAAGSTAGKVRSRAEALAWRTATGSSPKTVFTNGVFDLLHRGHVEYLEQARALGGRLIVGINTDRSAALLAKGPSRPVVPELDRARVIAGLGAVDCVVLFDEPTPLELIQELRPDVLVKGADYARDQVVGGDFVESIGGRVVLIPLVPDQSSTSLMGRIRDSR